MMKLRRYFKLSLAVFAVLSATFLAGCLNNGLPPKTDSEKYTICYKLVEGETLPEDAMEVYEKSDADQELPVPLKSGYDFKGWQIENTEEVITAISAGATGNLDLIATWQIKSFTITFDYSDYGSGDETERIVAYGETVTALPEVVPTTGKQFNGWHIGTADGGLFEEGIIYNYEQDITLVATYADVTETSYTVSYNLNGGYDLPYNAIKIYTESEFDRALPTASRIDYNFVGWKVGDTEEVITSIKAGTTGNLILTAVWSKMTYSILFDDGKGGIYEPIDIQNGDIIENLPEAIAPDGQVFEYWETEYGEKITNGEEFNFHGDVEVFAVFEAKKFFVTLHNATKSPHTAWTDESVGEKLAEVEKGDTIVIPEIEFDILPNKVKQLDDYMFLGWFYVDKDGHETKLDTETEFSFKNLNVNECELFIYAKVKKQWVSG